MKLYLILPNTQDDSYVTNVLLLDSAKVRGVEVQLVHADTFDFTSPVTATTHDFVYRVDGSQASKAVEHHFLVHSEAKSFYTNSEAGVLKPDNVYQATLIHQKHGLPIIPTIFSFPTNKEMLEAYVEKLGGYPIILKSTGGSHGVGVVKIDSFTSLTSVADLLTEGLEYTHSRILMRQYIEVKAHARLIVLDGKVIASITYLPQKKDFRTNAGTDISVTPTKFSDEIEHIARESVSSLNWKFGGVDILIDQQDRPWIAEVNLPCFFPRAQEVTKIDVSGAMIDYMLEQTK